MRVFITGATGFLGYAIVKELIDIGHQVTGLARSDASAKKLTDVGAQVLRGGIEDLDILRRGASAAEGVIHTAFYHEITHMRLGTRLSVFLGGGPTGIVTRFLAAAIQADKRALETLGQSLNGSDRPLVATFGTMGIKPYKVAIEDDADDPKSAGAVRGSTENTMRMLASQCVRTSRHVESSPDSFCNLSERNPLFRNCVVRCACGPALERQAKKMGRIEFVYCGPAIRALAQVDRFTFLAGVLHEERNESIPVTFAMHDRRQPNDRPIINQCSRLNVL